MTAEQVAEAQRLAREWTANVARPRSDDGDAEPDRTRAGACRRAARAEPADDIRAALDRGDYTVALRLLKPLAERGDAEAQPTSRMFGAGTAFRSITRPRRIGTARPPSRAMPAAQNALGALYAAGLGVRAGPRAKRSSGIARAAEQGAPAHQFDLALMYDNGLGVAQDLPRAAEWYAQGGRAGLRRCRGQSRRSSTSRAPACRRISPRRSRSTPARPARGNAKAQNNLGLMYTRGEGVAQNYAAAVDWYRKAAAQGFAKAITNLGVMYENGFGVTQDEDEARRLYRLGGRQAADASETALDRARFLHDAKASDPRALAAAAARGDAKAQFDLGLRYARGLGVPQDYVLGYMWLNLSAAHGLADAIRLRDALGAKLTAAQVNEAQRLARERWEAGCGPVSERALIDSRDAQSLGDPRRLWRSLSQPRQD